jgi:hypothetical protein
MLGRKEIPLQVLNALGAEEMIVLPTSHVPKDRSWHKLKRYVKLLSRSLYTFLVYKRFKRALAHRSRL